MAEFYTPKIVQSNAYMAQVEMLLELHVCPECGKFMLGADADFLRYLFPSKQSINSVENQLTRADFGWRTTTRNGCGDAVCNRCRDSGNLSFVCAGCQKQQSIKEIQEQFGNVLPDYLCKTCYSTISAKDWEDLNIELDNKHQYDY
jgi:hypothetical protein